MPKAKQAKEAKKLDSNYYTGLHASIISKLAAIQEFNQKMGAINERLKGLREALLDAAPKKLRLLLEEEVITSLIDYGQCRVKLSLPDDRYKLPNFIGMQAQIVALKKAWKYVVTVRASTRKDYDDSGECYEINFSAYSTIGAH